MRYFEDPVVWKDEFQYHMIVNHWNNKIAYYSRSRDGFHWVVESGTAYDPTVAVHADGTKEEWTKFERPRVYQDEHGRAVYLNMAVIDVEKSNDVAGDTHSSKNIVMPLNPGLRMEVLNETPIAVSTEAIRVKIYKEEGFNPTTNLDIQSLRFGSHGTVNAGGGATVTAQETDSDGNLVVIFNGVNTGLAADEFAPKMIGKYAANYTPSFPNAQPGSMAYGYARLSYIDYEPAYLSPALPAINGESKVTAINVKNYGLKSSGADAVIKVLAENGTTVLATGTVPATSKYATALVQLTASARIPAGSNCLKVAVCEDGKTTDIHTLQLTEQVEAQKLLKTSITEAETLAANTIYKYGKEELSDAIAAANAYKDSYSIADVETALQALSRAINTFKADNASSRNPISIIIRNADMSSFDGWDCLNMNDTEGGFKLNANNNKNYNQIGSSPFVEAYKNTGIAKPNYLKQTLGEMAAGRYVFEADVIVQQGSGPGTGVSLFLNDELVACSSKQTNYSEHYSVEVTTAEPGSLTFGLNISEESNATWVAFDNAVLKYYGDGSRDDEELFYNASLENVYVKASGLTNGYVTVEPNYGNYLNRHASPNANSEWALIKDSETKDIWLYNTATQSFIIPSGNFWKTSTTVAQKTLDIIPDGSAYMIKCLDSGNNIYMNAFGGDASREITTGLNGYAVGAYRNGSWELPATGSTNMPQFTLSDITTGLDDLKTTLAKLPRAAVIEVKDYGYSTFCAPFDVEIPDGLEAYTADINATKDALILTRLYTSIPANTAVILRAEGGFGPYYVCGDTEAQSATVATGSLVGVLSAETDIEVGSYVLQNQSSCAGFYKTAQVMRGTKNKCFVPSGLFSSQAKSLTLIFENETVGISRTSIVSERNADQPIYNICGQQVDKEYKGIRISRGMKTVKK